MIAGTQRRRDTPTLHPDLLARVLDQLPTSGQRTVEVLPNHASAGGPGEAINLVPLDEALNGSGPGSYGELEASWRAALRDNPEAGIRVSVEVVRPPCSRRPELVEENPLDRRRTDHHEGARAMTERNPGELVQEIGHEFFRAAPAGWVTGKLVYRRVGKTSESQATANSADGRLLNVAMTRHASRTLKELRAVMARPGTGTWFTAVGRFRSDGQMTWEFDRDNEPEWFVRVSPLHYLQEQQEFPRDEASTPEWMRERLREAAALGGL